MNRVTIARAALRDAVEALCHVTHESATVQDVRLHRTADGLYLSTVDDEYRCSVLIRGDEGDAEFDVTFDLMAVLPVVRHPSTRAVSPSDAVTIEYNESVCSFMAPGGSYAVTVSTDRHAAPLRQRDPEKTDFPAATLSVASLAALTGVHFAAADETHPTINAVLFRPMTGQLLAAGTNGHRLATAKRPAATSGAPFLISPTHARWLAQVCRWVSHEDAAQIWCPPQSITVAASGFIFTAPATTADHFPRIDAVIPDPSRARHTFAIRVDPLRAALLACRARPATGRATRLTLVKGQRVVVFEPMDAKGSCTFRVPIGDTPSADFTTGFAVDYMLNALDALADWASVRMRFESPVDAYTIVPDEPTPLDLHVIMPMKL